MGYVQFAVGTVRTLTSAAAVAATVIAASAITAGTASAVGPARTATVAARTQAAPQFTGTVRAIAHRGDTVYVGGSFSGVIVGGRVIARQRLAAFSARTGALLSWRPTVNGTVKALAVSGNAVFAAGTFSAVSGVRRDSLVRLDATSGAVGSFSHNITGSPTTLAVGNGRLYVGGSFNKVDGSRRGNLAAFSVTSGALDRGWQARADNHVDGLATYGARVYLGGNFRSVNGSRRAVRLAAVAGTTGKLVLGFRPLAPAVVLDVAVDQRGVYSATGGAGGKAVGYTTAGRVRWTHLFNGDVHTLTTLRGVTYVGGHFDTACRRSSTIKQLGCIGGTVSRVKLAAIGANGQLSSWNPRANGVVGVRAMATISPRAQVAVGGEFTTIGGRKRERYVSFG